MLRMEWHLRNCYRWTLVISFSVLLCFAFSSTAAADSLQSTNNDRNSLFAITDSLQPGSEERSPLVPNSLQANDDRSPLWELPIITEPDCDLSTPDGRICSDADAGGVISGKDDTEEEKQEAVLCNVKCFRADPVCGEDAITYWCGAAEAKCAGVEVAYTGYCDSRSGGAGKDSGRAAQSLFLVHFIWLVLAGFLVIADLL